MKRAFTLVELLIVIAIIGILLAIILPILVGVGKVDKGEKVNRYVEVLTTVQKGNQVYINNEWIASTSANIKTGCSYDIVTNGNTIVEYKERHCQ